MSSDSRKAYTIINIGDVKNEPIFQNVDDTATTKENDIMNIRTMLGVTTILTVSVTFCFPTASRADAIYNVIVLADLRITGFSLPSGNLDTQPEDLLISANVNVVDEDAITEGTAFAEQFADTMVFGIRHNDVGFDEGLSLQALATGYSTLGTAVSFAFTQGILAINNLSATESYTIDIEADYSSVVDTNVIDSNLEFASAESVITLDSQVLGSLLDRTLLSDSDFGGGLLTENAILPFSILVEPRESEVLALTTQTAGIATAAQPVPEPSTIALLSLGLLGTAIMQWRKKQSRPHPVDQFGSHE